MNVSVHESLGRQCGGRLDSSGSESSERRSACENQLSRNIRQEPGSVIRSRFEKEVNGIGIPTETIDLNKVK